MGGDVSGQSAETNTPHTHTQCESKKSVLLTETLITADTPDLQGDKKNNPKNNQDEEREAD